MYLRMMVESTGQQAVCIPWECPFDALSQMQIAGSMEFSSWDRNCLSWLVKAKNPDSITLLSSIKKKKNGKKKGFSGNCVILLVLLGEGDSFSECSLYRVILVSSEAASLHNDTAAKKALDAPSSGSLGCAALTVCF